MASPVIPPPPNPNELFDGTTWVFQGMRIDEAYVGLFYDELTVRFSILRPPPKYLGSISPLRIMKAGGIVEADGVAGVVVLELSVSCGGTIVDDYTETPGDPADFELIQRAIPYFYPYFFEPQSRKVMRAVYRRVQKLCSTPVAS